VLKYSKILKNYKSQIWYINLLGIKRENEGLRALWITVHYKALNRFINLLIIVSKQWWTTKITRKFDFGSFRCAILNYVVIISDYVINFFFNNIVNYYIFNLICEIFIPEHLYFIACKSSNFESIVNYLELCKSLNSLDEQSRRQTIHGIFQRHCFTVKIKTLKRI